MRLGAHQVAQKSTTARPLCCSICNSKSESFTSTAFDILYSPTAGHPAVGEYKMSNAVEVNDSDFELQIEQHKGLAVVDFWATWCAPSRMIAPVLDQLAIEYKGKAKVAKVDVDVNLSLIHI